MSMKVLIAGPRYGRQNVGDEAILKAIIADLRSINTTLDITVFTDEPEKTSKLFNVRAYRIVKKRGIFKHLFAADLFVCGGATILSDLPRHALGLALLAKLLRKPVMIYGVGMNPISDRKTRKWVRFVCNRVDLISVRDGDVKTRLLAYGVTKTPIYVTADPAVLVEPASPDRIQNILDSIGIHDGGVPIVGVGLSSEPDCQDIYPQQTIAQLLDYLVSDRGFQILFIPMNGNPEQDIALMKKIKDKMRRSENVYFLKPDLLPQEVMGVISKFDFVLSSRMHMLIFAACVNVPMIGISRCAKTDSFLARLGMQSVGAIEDVDFPKLKDAVDRTWKDRQKIKTNIDRKMSEMRKCACINRTLVSGFIDNNEKVLSE